MLSSKLKQDFEKLQCQEDNPFVHELWRKARNSAKKYDTAFAAMQKAKGGEKLNQDQKEKIRNLEDYKKSVFDILETLTLYQKHHKSEPKQVEETKEEAPQPVEQEQEEEQAEEEQEPEEEVKEPEPVEETPEAEVEVEEAAPPQPDDDSMRLIATVYKLGASNIQFTSQFRLSQAKDQKEALAKLNLPLNQQELMALHMFYTFTFQNPPQLAGNTMKSNTDHIADQLKKLALGSDEQLPFNNFYTYRQMKDLYQKMMDDEQFMEDPAWLMGQQGMPPMPMMAPPMGIGGMAPPQMQMFGMPGSLMTGQGQQQNIPVPQAEVKPRETQGLQVVQQETPLEEPQEEEDIVVGESVQDSHPADDQEGEDQNHEEYQDDYYPECQNPEQELQENPAELENQGEGQTESQNDQNLEDAAEQPQPDGQEQVFDPRNADAGDQGEVRGRGERGRGRGRRGRGRGNYFDRGGRARYTGPYEAQEGQGQDQQYFQNNYRGRGRRGRGRGNNPFFRNNDQEDSEGFQEVREQNQQGYYRPFRGRGRGNRGEFRGGGRGRGFHQQQYAEGQQNEPAPAEENTYKQIGTRGQFQPNE